MIKPVIKSMIKPIGKPLIKVAVIGLGNMGKHHARNYESIEKCSLVAVCDVNQELSMITANRFSCKAYFDYKMMLDHENIQAVSIAVPTHLHKVVALYCIEKGIDVLIEKPIAPSVEEAEEIIKKAKEKNVVLQIGHIERYNPAVRKLKQIIKDGKLGDVSSIIARRVGAVPVQIRDMNVIIDLAVHDIDIISYLYESQPEKILGNIGKAMVEKREDYAEIFLKYGNKSGFIQVNWITPIKIRNLSITGSKGYAELNYITQELTVYESNYTKEGIDEYGDYVIKFGIPDKTQVGVEEFEPLLMELTDFMRCVKERDKPLASGEVGLEALRIALEVIHQNG
jgi:UDP-N-acetylglucosamine 3-dehydrogenase